MAASTRRSRRLWTSSSMRRLKAQLRISFKTRLCQAHAYPNARSCSNRSGKTLCYLLPLLEHVKVQETLRPQDGCIGLILLPTKESCQQVKEETDLWCKYSDFGARAASSTKGDRQPERGRYDILCASAGRLGSLLKDDKFDIMRATFVVVGRG